MGHFEGGHHYLCCLTVVWPQVNNREETQPHPSTENWIKDLLSMAPPIRTRPSLPFSSLSHQEASISLLCFSITGQTENHNHRKLANLVTWTTALSNSMKSLIMKPLMTPCHVGPPKTDGSWWRCMTECGPLEKGMANNFSILALRTRTSMKRQNDRILEEELPSSLSAQYATGDQWRNNSRKNEGMEPKQK